MNGMLNKVVAWLRAGYATDAPQFGYAALLSLCPEAASTSLTRGGHSMTSADV